MPCKVNQDCVLNEIVAGANVKIEQLIDNSKNHHTEQQITVMEIKENLKELQKKINDAREKQLDSWKGILYTVMGGVLVAVIIHLLNI